MASSPALKKNGNKRRWRSIIAVFFAVFLVLASLKGFIRSDATNKTIAKSKLDDTSSLVVNLSGKSNSLFIFQKDPQRAVILALGENIKVAQNEQEVLKNISLAFAVPIENYIKFKNGSVGNIDDISKKYAKFVSWTTPIQLLTTGWGGDDLNTNISRIDAIKLWWQLKSIGVNSLKINDLTAIGGRRTEVGNEKVLAENSQELNREISKYLENTKIINEDFEINIINASSEFAVSRLANSFITSVGGRVGSITGNSNYVSKCTLLTNKRSYSANYLANIFDCDIKDASQSADSGQITLILGNEFAKRYFE